MVEEFWHFQACLFLSTVNCKLWRARIKMMMKECKLAGWGQTDGEDEGRVRLFHILLKFARQWDGEKDFDEDYARGGDNLKEMQKEKEDTSSFSYLVPHASKKLFININDSDQGSTTCAQPRHVPKLGFNIKVGKLWHCWSFWWNWRWCNWPPDVIASQLVSLRLLFQKHLTLTPPLIGQNTLVSKLRTVVREMKILMFGDAASVSLQVERGIGWHMVK